MNHQERKPTTKNHHRKNTPHSSTNPPKSTKMGSIRSDKSTFSGRMSLVCDLNPSTRVHFPCLFVDLGLGWGSRELHCALPHLFLDLGLDWGIILISLYCTTKVRSVERYHPNTFKNEQIILPPWFFCGTTKQLKSAPPEKFLWKSIFGWSTCHKKISSDWI